MMIGCKCLDELLGSTIKGMKRDCNLVSTKLQSLFVYINATKSKSKSNFVYFEGNAYKTFAVKETIEIWKCFIRIFGIKVTIFSLLVTVTVIGGSVGET